MTRVAGVSCRVRNGVALGLMLLQSVSMNVSVSGAVSQVPASIVWEYDGPACQGEPIMKHYLMSRAVSECKAPANQPTGTGKCQQTTDGTSSFETTCHTGTTDSQIPPAGYLCRVMYNMSPTCSDPAAIKRVDCFTLAKAGKCWQRSVSGFSVTPLPSEAGAGVQSMKLSLDDGSLTSGKQYTGPVHIGAVDGGAETVKAYDSAASGSDDSNTCGDGSCRCSTQTVRNGECDGFGTKYVW